MGWLLRRQLSEPGAGSCCAVSMGRIIGRRVAAAAATVQVECVKMSFTWLSQGRRVGDRRLGGRAANWGGAADAAGGGHIPARHSLLVGCPR